MTKDEIKAIVAAKIAGQGTNVDGGGALSDVLNAILDAIPEIPESGVMPEPKYVLRDFEEEMAPEDFADAVGLSKETLPDFFKAAVIRYRNYFLTRTYAEFPDSGYYVIFGNSSSSMGAQLSISYVPEQNKVSVEIDEV